MTLVSRFNAGGLLSLMALLVATSVPVMAQTSAGGSPSVYRYAEPGEPTVAVQVWGDVRATGLYVVQQDTDLVRLLTLAGGPALPGDRPRQRVTVNVSVTRNLDGARSEIFSAPIADLTRDASVHLPGLRDGDVVQVETSVRRVFDWRDAMAIVSSAGTLALLILRISDRL